MIPLPKPTKLLESKNNKGIFEIEALYPGFGINLGNSLRRVLLSSLGGAAIVQVKIKGVDHEFSTIPGVLEDVISILLNLKQLRFKVHGEEAQRATLKVKGEKEVTGADFSLPSQVELVNKDFVIAHLTSKSAELDMEIVVEKGVGYVPSEERSKEKEEIGTISLDAIFTPIRRVSSKVENMRVGDRTDFNRLIIEIDTDGTISPEEAFYQAAEILQKHFEVIIDGMREKAEAKASSAGKTSEVKEKKKTTVKKTAKAKVAKKVPKSTKSKKK